MSENFSIGDDYKVRDLGLAAPKSRVATEVPALADTLARASALHARLLRVQDGLDRLSEGAGDPAAERDPLTGMTSPGIGGGAPVRLHLTR